MSLVLAKKYLLLTQKDQIIKEKLAEILKDFEIEIIPFSKKEFDLSKIEYKIANFDFAVSFLAPYQKKENFLKKILKGKIVLEKDVEFKEDKELENLVSKIAEIEKEKEKLKERKKEIEKEILFFSDLKNLTEIPISTKYISAQIISLAISQEEKFFKIAKKENIFFQKIGEKGKSSLFFVIFLKEKKFSQILKELQVEIINYPYQALPKDKIEELKKKESEIKEREEFLEKELKEISKKIEKIKIYRDLLSKLKAKVFLKENIFEQKLLNYFLFFTSKKEKEKIEKKLKEENFDFLILELKEKKENLPVILKNKKIFFPFQYITEIFGLPKPDEIDPTPYLSFFFILFFAICLTDAGYGILLFLMSLVALIFLRKRIKDKKLLLVLALGGVVTFLVGSLFGSYFGISAEKIPLSFFKKIKLIDPIKNTVLFLGITFILGYLQLVFAQIVKIISAKKRGDKNTIFNGIAWIITLFSFSVFLLTKKFPSLKIGAGVFVGISALSLIIAESKGTKNIFLKPLVGLIKVIQGMIGVVSDILSYSRLMALGLATSVIALIINQIAQLFKNMIPYFGYFIAFLILVGGHLFNLGINALSGFIHSGRLQFVEFFPKFLEGGGRRFKPLKPELKYVQIR